MFGKGSTLTLSKKIKQISEDVVVTKAKLKKLIISHKVKRYNNWRKPFVKNNKKIKIYYDKGNKNTEYYELDGGSYYFGLDGNRLFQLFIGEPTSVSSNNSVLIYNFD